jgi:hypothetical protein
MFSWYPNKESKPYFLQHNYPEGLSISSGLGFSGFDVSVPKAQLTKAFFDILEISEKLNYFLAIRSDSIDSSQCHAISLKTDRSIAKLESFMKFLNKIPDITSLMNQADDVKRRIEGVVEAAVDITENLRPAGEQSLQGFKAVTDILEIMRRSMPSFGRFGELQQKLDESKQKVVLLITTHAEALNHIENIENIPDNNIFKFRK